MSRACSLCGATIDETMPIFRSTVCPSCGKDLKICRNCRFYNVGAHWDCLESIPEPVADKDRSNFCDYFQFRAAGESVSPTEQKKAKEDFKKLFGNG